MAFPESERVVYATHTLEQVICQLQFPPILAIGSEPPARFQEEIRAAYPLYRREEGLQAPPPIADLLAQLPTAPPQTVRHTFTSEDERLAITVAPDFVAVTDTDYVEWADFRAEVERAKAAIEATYGPAFYTRTGLRYRDVIDKQQLGLSEAWDELLNPTLAGLLGGEEGPLRDAVKEVAGNALIELDDVDGGLIRLQHGLGQRTPEAESQVYLIDADYHTQSRQEGDNVLGLLDRFNREAGNLFRWSISPILHDALGRRAPAANPI